MNNKIFGKSTHQGKYNKNSYKIKQYSLNHSFMEF